MSSTPLTATVAGVPRIGPRRELKKALETYWKDPSTAADLAETNRQLVDDLARTLTAVGVEEVPTAAGSFYDAVLDATALLGLLPARVSGVPDHEGDGLPRWIDRYFTAARGSQGIPAAAMTKWFDTNYHYIVPELSADSTVELAADEWVAGIARQVQEGLPVRPVVVGPVTLLALSRAAGGFDPFALLGDVVRAYGELLVLLAEAGVTRVQFDEPWLVTDIAAAGHDAETVLGFATEAYTTLAKAAPSVAVHVQTYFGDGDRAVAALQNTGVASLGVDVVTFRTDERAAGAEAAAGELVPSWQGGIPLHVGVVDGRNIWRTDLRRAHTTLQQLAERGPVVVSTSAPLLHVPYTLEGETSLDGDDELRSWLAFAYEKAAEVATLARLLAGTATDADQRAVDASAAAAESREASSRTHNPEVRARAAAVTAADRRRGDLAHRVAAQHQALGLPPLPTTTIGSFPQTPTIRRARADHKAGTLSDEAYTQAMIDEIATCIRRQEDLDIDVLVHGEAERNDMVQYFSEQLEGYHSTDFGWVQSYGSRCVRPPILFGDISRPAAMTCFWFAEAQKLTDRPVKGMLTGPVTMLAWSFVRDDQPLAATADQVALVLRDEIDDLVDAGAKIIQVDEPAIRELLPLNDANRPAYLTWSVGSFRLATAGVDDATQIHTHMCYSSFNELIDTIAALDADVTSIEASRNGMVVLQALKDSGFGAGVGPGVWDIHSPRVPDRGEVDRLIADAVACVPPNQLWINPDCGLKTRGWEETIASLEVLVAAAKAARASLG